ncbi:MAG: MarR family transcriptional regulator [Thermoplasmatota archaeon]
MHNQLERYNIGSGQFHYLMLLYHKDGINQETLSEILKIDKATSARAIRKLEETGYITRKRDQQDKRAYKIYLTKKAQNLRPTIKNILQEWTKQLLQGITKEEEQHLLDLLERIAHNATTFKKLE